MTVELDGLLAIGDRIAGWARDGEQIEAVVVHSRDTEIRAYEGDIEQLASAESQGVGIRVIRDQRVGFARPQARLHARARSEHSRSA